MKKTGLNLLVLLTISALSQLLVFGQTVINDNFNGTTINTNVWTVITPFCDSQMYETNCDAVFVNSGKLVSIPQLPVQYVLNGSFEFTGSSYDQFLIAIRSSGAYGNTSEQLSNGVQIRFQVRSGDQGEAGVDNIKILDTTGTEIDASFPIQMNTYYPFTLFDTGTNVVLYFNGGLTPLLTMNTTNRNGYSLGMQNREGECGGSSISAGSITDLHYLTVINTTFATGILTFPAITITGSTNQIYSIQYATNLLNTNWTTLASNIVLSSNTYVYPDTNVIGQAQRFYRVVAQ